MSSQEVGIITELLKPDWRCLEYGSGGSTIYFPQFVKTWTSIESDYDYYSEIKNHVPFNVSLNLETDQEKYVDALGRFDFDFILVDGQWRKECLYAGLKKLNENGILLLHDADRKDYNEWVNDFPNKVLVRGELPEGDFYKHRGLRLYNGGD